MSTRQEDNDGSDIFWPGYVDATTNLILNLLFLLTILMVAVFMFALELGRTTKVVDIPPPVTSSEQESELTAEAKTGLTQEEMFAQAGSAREDGLTREESIHETDLALENLALKREVQRLNLMLAEQLSQNEQVGFPQNEQAGGLQQSAAATLSEPKPLHGLDKAIATDFEIIVRFKDEAVAFTQEEHDQLIESLRAIDTKAKTTITVEVPTGFSEAKRMGFYRALAVRNLLIEMNLPQENIDVSVVEGRKNANASLVRVRAQR